MDRVTGVEVFLPTYAHFRFMRKVRESSIVHFLFIYSSRHFWARSAISH